MQILSCHACCEHCFRPTWPCLCMRHTLFVYVPALLLPSAVEVQVLMSIPEMHCSVLKFTGVMLTVH